MLTTRGWWFLIAVIFIFALGAMIVSSVSVAPVLLALSLLAWFCFEWVLFSFRRHAAAARLRITRRVVQGDREVPMVWAGIHFEVQLAIEHDGGATLPFAVVEDRLPQAAARIDGTNEATLLLAPHRPESIRYSLKAAAPGVLRFEGVKVRVADLHGFFYHRFFLHEEVEYLILPPLSDDEGRQRADKRFNSLPPPGVHRFRRPGSGSELLDLRDYRPGDPPKMIAWKPSARRDRLITKEYESDVPVRCVLFLDITEGMRLGPPGETPLTKMAGVASVVAQAAAANRDLVGLTTFDETESKGTSPARTKLHMIHVLRRLAEVSALQPGTRDVPPEELTRRAYPLAHELYPELMTKKVNSMPLGRLWIPLLDRWWGWIILFVIVFSPLMFLSKDWLGTMIEFSVRRTDRSWPILLRAIVAVFLMTILIFLPATLGYLFWGFYGIRGWFGDRRTQLTRRKQLAALFTQQDGADPSMIERLIHDDEAYGQRIGRFLQERQVRMPVPLYDKQGRYRFRCSEKVKVLARAIVRAVSGARDNELYVILADLAELHRSLTPLLKAARVARARHHQVLVIVPWPADMPPPDTSAKTGAGGKPRKKPPRAMPVTPSNRPGALLPLVKATLTKQYHESFRKFRRAMGQAGAVVVRVSEGDPVHAVLDRLDRLRGMRTRR
jgi:uncharacterized protein (DUF58 family)